VPLLALSVCPTCGVPLTDGSVVFFGAAGGGAGAVTVAVAAEDAAFDPPALLAVTTARSVCPTSAATSL